MSLRPKKMVDVLGRQVSRLFTFFWLSSLLVCAAYVLVDAYKLREELRQLVSSQIIASARSADERQDWLQIAQELKRFSDAMNSQGYGVRGSVRLDDRLVASSELGDGFSGIFTTSDRQEVVLPSSANLVVDVSVSFTRRVIGTIQLFTLLSILLAIAYLIARWQLRKTLAALMRPFQERVDWIARFSRSIPSKFSEIKKPTSANFVEMIRLDESVDAFAQSIQVYSKELVESQREKEEIRARAIEEKAVAQMAHMLAHDVKRPFTTLRMALEAIAGAGDASRIKKIAAAVNKEVTTALQAVDAMADDVVELGNIATLCKQEVSFDDLLGRSVTQVCRMHSNSDIHFDYAFSHDYLLSIDAPRMSRALVNIIENAFQALDCTGKIWVRTREVSLDATETRFLEVCIGNSGPVIPADQVGSLFSKPFSSGKSGGAGIGLAVAKKIVTLHQGQIWCESSSEKGTEFYVTLPLSHARSLVRHSMPKHTGDVSTEFDMTALAPMHGDPSIEGEDVQ